MNKRSFTLLELIIVIIIIGVLTSLALPRLFKTVECATVAEAVSIISTIRRGMEVCILMNNGDVQHCFGDDDIPQSWERNLGMSDPSDNPGSHFCYAVAGTIGFPSETFSSYHISARLKPCDGNSPGMIFVRYTTKSEDFIPDVHNHFMLYDSLEKCTVGPKYN